MHISSIKLRGFKSFKRAEIELPHDFICLAGPNGSGKTNVLDAVRFALGEKSLKSLRARKVKDLICHNSKVAEVILNFQDDKKYELRRAIKEDGKVRYVLNGKTTTRTSILELLKKYNLDSSGRNIIAQGEVQRIVEITNSHPVIRTTGQRAECLHEQEPGPIEWAIIGVRESYIPVTSYLIRHRC